MVLSSFHSRNILISLTLYFYLNIKDCKCRAVEKREEKNGKAYSTKLCQNRLRRCILCQKDSSENFDSAGALACRVLLNIAVYVFETPQLTLEAT